MYNNNDLHHIFTFLYLVPLFYSVKEKKKKKKKMKKKD